MSQQATLVESLKKLIEYISDSKHFKNDALANINSINSINNLNNILDDIRDCEFEGEDYDGAVMALGEHLNEFMKPGMMQDGTLHNLLVTILTSIDS